MEIQMPEVVVSDWLEVVLRIHQATGSNRLPGQWRHSNSEARTGTLGPKGLCDKGEHQIQKPGVPLSRETTWCLCLCLSPAVLVYRVGLTAEP